MTIIRSRIWSSIANSVTISFLIFALLLPIHAALTLDTTFNSTGKVTLSFPDSSSNYTAQAFRVFVQPNNRIIVGGSFTNRTADGQLTGVAWAGFTPSGGLDSGFGSGGTITDWRSDALTSFRDALMYADGSTLRLSQILRLPAGSRTATIVRLNTNGEAGNVITIGEPFGFTTVQPVQVTVRSDGKILVLIADGGYFLYRFNPDGTSDTTFGVNGRVGIVFNKISGGAPVIQLTALGDGKILIVGNAGPFDAANNSSDFFIARLTETGNWDKTFGRVGFLSVPYGSGLSGQVRNALLQADGKILLCGTVTSSDTDVWMARFRPNGRLDGTFGENGAVIHDLAPGDTDVANSVALSPDGKIRMAGQLGPASTSSLLVARFSANGAFEEQTSFSFTTGQYSVANDITLQPDGKLLVVGQTRNPNMSITGGVMAIARLTE